MCAVGSIASTQAEVMMYGTATGSMVKTFSGGNSEISTVKKGGRGNPGSKMPSKAWHKRLAGLMDHKWIRYGGLDPTPAAEPAIECSLHHPWMVHRRDMEPDQEKNTGAYQPYDQTDPFHKALAFFFYAECCDEADRVNEEPPTQKMVLDKIKQ
jgi:hypothetical protein